MNPCVDADGNHYRSQKDAANALGKSETAVSRHLDRYGDLHRIGRTKRNWSERDLIKVLDMRRRGRSFSQIATHMNTTRAAIAGLVYRMKQE